MIPFQTYHGQPISQLSKKESDEVEDFSRSFRRHYLLFRQGTSFRVKPGNRKGWYEKRQGRCVKVWEEKKMILTSTLITMLFPHRLFNFASFFSSESFLVSLRPAPGDSDLIVLNNFLNVTILQ